MNNLTMIRFFTVTTTCFVGLVPLGLLFNPNYERPAILGHQLRESVPIFISNFCLVASTIPILMDILFDMGSGFYNSEQSVTFLPVKKFVFDRFCILAGVLIPSVAQIIIALSSKSDMLVGYFNLNTVTAEIFWFLGILFAVFERLGHHAESSTTFQRYCIFTTLAMFIHISATLNYSVFNNSNLALSICSWLFGTCLLIPLAIMYNEARLNYLVALKIDPEITSVKVARKTSSTKLLT